jgi:hypothetical protein
MADAAYERVQEEQTMVYKLDHQALAQSHKQTDQSYNIQSIIHTYQFKLIKTQER